MTEPLSFSFEFFPPSSLREVGRLMETVEALVPMRPQFISVTSTARSGLPYAATDLVLGMHRTFGIPVAVHLTSMGKRRADVEHIVETLAQGGITHLIVLRGDRPANGVMPPGDFPHASDLVAFLREIEEVPFQIGAACYPAVHPEAANAASDLRYLKEKVDAGVDFLVSQMFFDPAAFIVFTEQARAAGIHVPIIPGIMPITRAGQAQSFARKCGVVIPEPIRVELARHDSVEDISALGEDIALRQCQELLATGVRSFHFYTLNGSSAASNICKQLQDT